jgi:hypothetical protein
MVFFLYFWAFSAVPAVLISLPIIALGWKRAHWYWWELVAIVFPFTAWITVYAIWQLPESKGIGNVFGEPILVGLLIPVAALLRILAGKGNQIDQRRFALAVQVGLGVAAGLIALAWPNIHAGF